ncbi:hypothetical protein ACFE04_024070 [Oxalis oulophora]
MALCYSTLTSTCIYSSSPLFTPAKTSTSLVILRTPSTRHSSHFPLKAVQRPPHKYTYPDPVPEFAQAETQKFKKELLKKLLNEDKETFGDDGLDDVINVCAQIFSDFLHKEYGGPGTLLIEPFTDMFVALKERKLPGAPVASRAALLWAQTYVDQDWEVWNKY